jgi:hypothetical protein
MVRRRRRSRWSPLGGDESSTRKETGEQEQTMTERFIGRVRHADEVQARRWDGSETEGQPQMHIFHKDAYDWRIARDGHLHVRSKGSMSDEAGEMAEEALGFASTEGAHDPLTEHPSEEDEEPRLTHGGQKPWRRAHDGLRPPPVAGNGHTGAAYGLNEYFKRHYASRS